MPHTQAQYDISSFSSRLHNVIRYRKTGPVGKVLEPEIQGLHFLCCNLFDILLLNPENEAQVGLPSSMRYAYG